MSSSLKIDAIFDSPLKIAILRVFSARRGLKATGRQIARLCRYSASSTHDSLKDLYARDVLNLEIIGKQHLYSLNEANRIVTKVIRPMFLAESSMKEDIGKFLVDRLRKSGTKPKIVSLILYGSAKKDAVGNVGDIFLL